ncbi:MULTISPECIES: hypothetical protein [Sphingomonas]|jgi:hypothetical protein|nr:MULTISPECIES: hypothetical protein [Sphingomonas]MDF0490180.1 hypothetical protein [Sphingomonas pollutisoli]
MFGALADRGLRGLKRVIADDHKGLHAAAVKVSRFLARNTLLPTSGDLW